MLTFLKLLAKINPVKIIILLFLVISIILNLILFNIREPITEVVKYPIAFHNDQIILIYTGDVNTNNVRGWTIKSKYSTDVIKNNELIITNNIFSFEIFITILFVISSILLITLIIICIIEISNSDSEFFDLEKVNIEYLYTKIKYSEEGNIFFFYINDRLIGENNKLELKSDFYYKVKQYWMNKNLLPLWQGTTQEIRDKKLNDILKN